MKIITFCGRYLVAKSIFLNRVPLSEEINQNIQQIASNSSEMVQMLNHADELCGQLGAESDELNRQVDEFKA